MFGFIKDLFRPKATQADLDEAVADIMKSVTRSSSESINGYAEMWVKPDAEDRYEIYLKSMSAIGPREDELNPTDNSKLCLSAFLNHLAAREEQWNVKAADFFADMFSIAEKTGKGGLYEPLLRSKINAVFETIRQNARDICAAKVQDWESKGFKGKLTDAQIIAAGED